ncbi:MAG: rhomboid family intramembrane serine protease [Chloroflexi bacterium]|nr:rhomboid family intramembrane serine protease [Chloroflexota bacterium]
MPAAIATWTLAVANVVVWLFLEVNGGSQNVIVLLRFGAKYGPAVADGEYWRLLTAVFIHIGVLHLLTNTIGLLIFGGMVERAYGHMSFLAIYLFAGVFGNIASYAAGPTVSAGASGAVFGVVGAFAAYLAVNRRILGDLARRSLWGVVIIVGMNVVFGLSVGGVDNWAHLGGLISGALLGFALAPRLRFEAPAAPYGTPATPDFSQTGAPGIVSRAASFWRWQAAAVLSAVLVVATTYVITANYPYTPERIAATTVGEAEREIGSGNFEPAREFVDAMAATSRGGARLGLFYLGRGLEAAENGQRRSAVRDIETALNHDLPRDAARIADAALEQLGARR